MLQPGDTLAGYRIDELVGVGGMSTVYRATQLSLDRPVALKVLSTTLVGNRQFRERFRREGRNAAALDHPNIIPVYEAGESNGVMFIAMRLVDGASLAELIHQDRLTGAETLRILAAIGSALDVAHAAGLVHRDIKPQNILVTRSGHAYLADFGITKGAHQVGLTHSGDFVGSISYTPPEQIDGGSVTAASDIYALTAVLFQCLTGVLPYEFDSDAAIMRAHLLAPPPSLRATRPDAPAALDAVFAKGMSKAPDDRYASASELVAASAAALAGLSDALALAPAFDSRSDDVDDDVEFAHDAPAGSTFAPGRGASAPHQPGASSWSSGHTELLSAGGRLAADPTVADIRRHATAAEPARPGSGRLRRRGVALAVVALAVVAVIGYLLGRQPADTRIVSHNAAVSLVHGATWTATTARVPGVSIATPIALRSRSGVVLVAGRLLHYAPGYNPLSSTAGAATGATLSRTVVTVNRRAGVRYVGALRGGSRVWAVFLPDSRGWTGLACTGVAAATACPAVAATLRTVDARPVGLGPPAAAAATINRALGALARARAVDGARLASKSTKARAAAAAKLSVAHRAAGAAISTVRTTPQDRAPIRRLAAAFVIQSHDFTALAHAAIIDSPSGYKRALASITRQERELQRDLTAVRALGYR